CDIIDLDGKAIPTTRERSTYTHAQKMRAAATFGFGRVHGLGMQAWHRSEISGKTLGNPSVSETVSTYMLSLRRRKTQSGDTPTSARAATSVCILRLSSSFGKAQYLFLFHFNRQPQPSLSPTTKGHLGPRARLMMNCGYNFAFCGLLRVDEMLKIQLQDITFEKNPMTGQTKLTLRLPFRKTSQFGGEWQQGLCSMYSDINYFRHQAFHLV
ncbi:uncharacterized protein C8R40DRAFT_1051204, partial [Lentinula edodes]|uniref:uncharacterized protein n=1 Tax=Lentinula edodes TaxID=5353 RepID=UPI001E8D4CD1